MAKPSKAMTEKMRRWLEQLRDHGPARRWPRSVIGWRAMSAGYTEWHDMAAGTERITEAGRTALQSHRGSHDHR